jgi:hypothetical protein
MELDPLVIAELRALFKSGATPSRLMRHIVAHHGSQPIPEIDRLIRAYFREGFGIPMFRASADILAMEQEDLRIADYSANVIHRMVETKSEWDKNITANGHLTTSWIDSLSASNESLLLEQSHPELTIELSGVWSSLDENAKEFIKRLLGNSRVLYEKVALLATLAEQLQQQVIALENALPSRDRVAVNRQLPD